MATKIQSLPMAVVFKLVKADLMESYRTHDVQVLSIGFYDPDDFDHEGEQRLMVTATVNSDEECFANDCGTHPWMMAWDEEECCFPYSQRWDQDEDDGELPENAVERCDYVGLTMGSADLTNCNDAVDINAELKVPVTEVRWGYPFNNRICYNVYHIEEAHTWGELLTRIVEVFQKEYVEHESEMAHALGDYIIELLEIHPNNLATVSFGS